MSDIADKIYAATGLTLGAEAADAIGRMIQQARRDALKEAAQAMQPMLRSMISRDEAVRIIRALGEKE
jgi:hypothetical protein